MTPAILLSNVTKVYRRRASVAALRNVSLCVEPRVRLAIKGPSGSGKSTLLNLMGGLDVPTSGSVALCGVDLGTLNEQRRSLLRRSDVAYVFQAYHLLPTLSCEENVAMPLYLQGRSSADVRARVGRALNDVGLGLRAQHLPDELSGGERQRVAIARALVTEPKVLLADEPTGNLDSDAGAQVLALLSDITREREATLVIVTHDERVTRQWDRVVVLREGQIEGAAKA